MKKQIILVIVIATTIAVLGPRDVRDLNALIVKTLVGAAGLMIQLGAAVHETRHPDHDPGLAEPEQPEQQDAGLRAGVSLKPVEWRHFRGTPMPNWPGCITTHCERMWDHELGRPFKRCWWKCRRPGPRYEEPPEPPARLYHPPRNDARPAPLPYVQEAAAAPSGFPLVLLLGVVALLGLFGLARLDQRARARAVSRDTETALRDAAAAAAAKARLQAAAAEADAVIKTYRARAKH